MCKLFVVIRPSSYVKHINGDPTIAQGSQLCSLQASRPHAIEPNPSKRNPKKKVT